MITNRLKLILSHVISSSQCAFVPGRLITNNIFIAYEAVHAIQRRRRGHRGVMSIKLDMSKAYNRIEWKFLEAIMLRLGFNPSWVALVLSCVSSISYKILMNG